MAGNRLRDRCQCGEWKAVKATLCLACSRQGRIKPTERVDLIPAVEPFTTWACPDCTYRIRDERTVVNEAVLEHKMAHERQAA